MTDTRTIVFAVLLLVPLVAPSGGTATTAGEGQEVPRDLPWWGNTDPSAGFHIRLPVTITNDGSSPLTQPAVLMPVDLAERLAAAGWPVTPSGDRDILKAFQLDPASVRVVAMQDLEAPEPGTTHGRFRTIDGSLEGDARYEVPSMVYPGNLTGPDPLPFDPRSNPAVSVVWRATGTLSPGETRAYVVYLDTLTNGEKPSTDYAGTRQGATLLNLFGKGSGTTLYGFAKSLPGQAPPTVHLFGTEEGTTATVSYAPPGQAFSTVPGTEDSPNPTRPGPDNRTTVRLPNLEEMVVKVEADHPVTGQLSGTGFVPSLDGGMAGDRFRFALTAPATWHRDTVYFINTGDDPTTIEVSSLDSEASETFHLSDASNPFPYTIGTRADPFTADCNPPEPSDHAPFLDSPGAYSAEVIKGGPVLLQLPPGPITQIPSRTGAPTGRLFNAVAGWTDMHAIAGGCQDSSRKGLAYAIGGQGSSNIHATSQESRTQVDPPQREGQTPPDPYPVAGPGDPLSGPFLDGVLSREVRDRPLTFHADQPIRLFAGLSPTIERIDVYDRPVYRSAPPVPRVAGPLTGSEGGRDFAGFGRTAILAPFPETQVTANLTYRESGEGGTSFDLGADQSGLLEPKRDGADPLTGYHLEANQPLVVLPTEISSGAMAAIPRFLDARAVEAQYRGYLLDLRSPTGLDPVTASTLSDQPVTFPLVVENLATRADGRPLADTINLKVSLPESGWDASLDRRTLTLGGGEQADVRLTVEPGADLAPGALGLVTVEATSEGNPKMSSRIQTVTHIKSDFDVGLWFDRVNGPSVRTQIVGPGNATSIPLVVQNTGSVPDTFELDAPLTEPGWSVVLLHEGREVSTIDLAPLEKVKLDLRVEPPPGAKDALLITPVTAQSTTSPAALDRVTATTKIRSPSDIRLEVLNTTSFVLPGEVARFPARLSNTGQGSAEVLLDARSDAAEGWTDPSVVVENKVTGEHREVSSLSLAPGDSALIGVRLKAEANATGGSSAGIRLAAEPADGGQATEGFLTANVRRVHRLNISDQGLHLHGRADGRALELSPRITNEGNVEELLRARPLDLPPGWAVNLTSEVLIPRNDTQQPTFQVVPPRHIEPGQYRAHIGLVSRDGHVTPMNVTVTVDREAIADLGGLPAIQGQPGWPATVEIPVTNTGNAPATVRVEAPDGEPWKLNGTLDAVTLAPGTTARIEAGWVTPRDARDGSSSHALSVVLDPEDPSLELWERHLTASVSIGRADVSVGDATTSSAPAGQVVRATVSNHGDRPARQLAAQLVVDDTAVDEVDVGLLPPGGQVNVTFLLPGGAGGSGTIVLDPEDRIVELDEANNLARVGPGAGAGVPWVSPIWIIGLLAVIGAATRGRRR